MRKEFIIAFSVWMLFVCAMACFGFYQIGKTNGTTQGYSEGLRVADSWKSRAERCEQK